MHSQAAARPRKRSRGDDGDVKRATAPGLRRRRDANMRGEAAGASPQDDARGGAIGAGAPSGAAGPKLPRPTWDDLYDSMDEDEARDRAEGFLGLGERANPQDPELQPGVAALASVDIDAEGKPKRLTCATTYLRGRLRARLSWWEATKAPKRVLEWIENGFPLPWVSDWARPAGIYPNHVKEGDTDKKWGLDVCSWISGVIKEYLEVGAVMRWKDARLQPGVPLDQRGEERPRLISPLSVVAKKSRNKLRLIFDLRHLNTFLTCGKFRMQTLSRMRNLLRKDDRFMGVDVASAYTHVDIEARSWTYFGFSFPDPETGLATDFVFCTFPFGAAFAPVSFTAIASHVAQVLRNMGIRTINYIDDFLFCFDPDDLRDGLHEWVWKTIEASGFVISVEKSDRRPVPVVTHQGFVIDGPAGEFRATDSRREEVVRLAEEMAAAGVGAAVKARELARLAGKLTSLSLVIGVAARVLTMPMYFLLEERLSWNGYVVLDEPVVTACEWWAHELPRNTTTKIWDLPPTWCGFCADMRVPQPKKAWDNVLRPPTEGLGAGVERLVHSDAGYQSAGGWLATVSDGSVSPVEDFVVAGDDLGEFDRDDAGANLHSSTLRELRGLREVIRRAAGQIKKTTCRFVLDSQAAVMALTVGRSRKRSCHAVVRSIYSALWAEEITPRWLWVPRDENTRADFLTHYPEIESWRATPALIDRCRTWARIREFRLDAFATATSRIPEAKSFCSRSPLERGTLGAFDDVNWSKVGAVWAFPPPGLAMAALAHARRTRAFGVMLLPNTRESRWRPVLHRLRQQKKVLVIEEEDRSWVMDGTGQPPKARGPGWVAVRFDYRRVEDDEE